LERPGVRGEVAQVRRPALGDELVDRRAAETRRPDHEQHLLRGEEHGPKEADEARRPAGDPVHPDPLPRAAATHARAAERDLDRLRPGPALDAGDVGAPPDQLRVGRRPVGSAPGEQHDRLEEARLAGGVRPHDEVRSRAEGELGRAVAAEVLDRDRVEHRGILWPGGAGHRQDVVRSGITTWT
jgi:hypothetical protein